MLALLQQPSGWLAFATLSLLEIVLGVDNVIFIALLVAQLPAAQQRRARNLGLALAMLTRLALLFALIWLTRLTAPLMTIGGYSASVRDAVLIAGGVFLIVNSWRELRATRRSGSTEPHTPARSDRRIAAIVLQIAAIDVVLSIDSVFTAVGMARSDQVPIMAAAIVVSILAMLWLVGVVAAFVQRYPTAKSTALLFLVLVGGALIASGLHREMPKGYLYAAMGLAVAAEYLIIRRQRAARRQG